MFGDTPALRLEQNDTSGLTPQTWDVAASDVNFTIDDPNTDGTECSLTSAGDLAVGGGLTTAAGAFKIDHPLHPDEQYLSHVFVASSKMMNVYAGNVVLDKEGEAWVMLPDWFEGLNRDFSYQLTPIGERCPNLHIGRKIEGNRFKIAGGKDGTRVSWLVTGIRQDPYANLHPVPVEAPKPAQSGQ